MNSRTTMPFHWFVSIPIHNKTIFVSNFTFNGKISYFGNYFHFPSCELVMGNVHELKMCHFLHSSSGILNKFCDVGTSGANLGTLWTIVSNFSLFIMQMHVMWCHLFYFSFYVRFAVSTANCQWHEEKKKMSRQKYTWNKDNDDYGVF